MTNSGSFIDGVLISHKTIADLDVPEHPYISVRIGVKPDAEFQGGVNLFGRYFGNYPQDMLLRLVYDKQELAR